VALHRAASLLYTFRFPLEDQGVLVIGPNRLFLRYIEQVLPSLGEAGVEQVVLSDLVPDVAFGAHDPPITVKVKGDVRMAEVLAKAVRDRQRALKQDLVVPFGLGNLRMRSEESERIVRDARRRYRRHNAARKYVEGEVFAALAASSRDGLPSSEQVRERTRHNDDVRVALERMWPLLTPAELLNDLFGSKSLLKLAAARWLDEGEYLSLHRERAQDSREHTWSEADGPLLDEARELLGPKPSKAHRILSRTAEGLATPNDDEIRTYGHIVIDEVQDLSPMALRMAGRRSLNGSMTVVGDLAQATGEHAPVSWDDVLAHLPDRKPTRLVELTVGYRIPETIMELADRVASRAVPGLTPPRAVRAGEHPPVIVETTPSGLAATVAAEVRRLQAELDDGVVAVITPDSLAEELFTSLTSAGLEVGQAARQGLDQPVTLVPVSLVKGLELDGVVVVEPARIVSEQAQGMRALYVALTRSTRELSVVHAEPLPF
jgi:DNA helicase IV